MQSYKIKFPQEIYFQELNIINGLKFTQREIDVIACILQGRREKWIAHFLDVGERAIEAQTRNIRAKIGCSSREGIIDFIESSSKLPFLRGYYSNLFINTAFEKSLKEIAKLKYEENPKFFVIYWNNKNLKNALFRHLEHHLNLARIKVDIQEQDNGQKRELHEKPGIIHLSFLQKEYSNNFSQRRKDKNCIDLSTAINYYFAVFEILKKLLPQTNLSKIIRDFEAQYYGLRNSMDCKSHKMSPSNLILSHRIKQVFYKTAILFKSKKILSISIFLIFGLLGIEFLTSIVKKKPVQNTSQSRTVDQGKKDEPLIRSDLVIPTEALFLKRPELIVRLDDALKEQKGIQTVALVGPGGSGKTTLARQYAHQQNAHIIWEINGETIENIRSSFESLAQALAQTEEERSTLKKFISIEDPEIREENIIYFVKRHLKIFPGWFLIFDNVEKFINIKKYFPQDAATCGDGKIILTTCDNNIQNNSHINHIIHIGELNPSQKFNLFSKIINHGNVKSLTSSQIEEAKAFLEQIPPFPLDVSLAAFYLKAANVSYAAYLDNIRQNNKEFEAVQKSLLMQTGDYTKTRYGIIISSLQHLIDEHKDFSELLLFISLLDSQNIPRALLNRYKDKAIVDNFIFNLKKHSLIITADAFSSNLSLTFSIHRNIQEICKIHLMKILGIEKNNKTIELISNVFNNYINYAINKEDVFEIKILVNHIEAFLSHAYLLKDITRDSISIFLGCIYYELSYYEKAKKLLEVNIIKLNGYSEKKYFEIARALEYLGKAYYALDDFENAKRVCEESCAIYEKYLRDHPAIARVLGFIAIVYKNLNNHKKANDYCEKSLKIYYKYSDKNNIEVAKILGYWGMVNRELGNYEKAKNVFEESLAIYKKNVACPWRVGWILGQLGNVYRELGYYKDAKIFLEQSIAIRKSFYESNDRIAWLFVYLGALYRDLGEYEKARDFIKQGLTMYKKCFGNEKNMNVAWALSYLGSVERCLNNYGKAKDLFEKSLSFYKEISYKNHIDIDWALVELANVYRELGVYGKSKMILNEQLATCEKNYGHNHIKTAQILRDIGRVYLQEGNLETSQHYFNKALDIFRQSKHPECYSVFESLADLHLKKSALENSNKNAVQSQKSKAQVFHFLNQALDVLNAYFPKDCPHIERVEAKLKKAKKENYRYQENELYRVFSFFEGINK